LVLFLLIIGCAKKEEKEIQPQLDIKIKTTEKVNFAYLENTGSYAELSPVFGQVMQYVMEKGISGMPMGIYYDDPAVVLEESLRCEIGMPVPEDFKPDPPFQVKEIPSQEVVYAVLKGPYDKIAEEYVKIIAWAQEKGYVITGPVTEIYLEGGEGIPESEFLTEVRFPVSKRD
jgi:effector-binding domain-containing protein